MPTTEIYGLVDILGIARAVEVKRNRLFMTRLNCSFDDSYDLSLTYYLVLDGILFFKKKKSAWLYVQFHKRNLKEHGFAPNYSYCWLIMNDVGFRPNTATYLTFL